MKLAVFDKEKVIFGSANFSYSGLKVNHEADVFINNKTIVEELTKLFEDDWQKSLMNSPLDESTVKAKSKKRRTKS